MKAPRGYDQIVKTYGDPTPWIMPDGDVQPAWREQILAPVELPFPLFLAWGDRRRLDKIYCHRLIATELYLTLEEVKHEVIDKGLALSRKGRKNEYGGCYAWRPMRGSRKLSTHCFGAAIDLDPEENRLGEEPTMRREVVEIFERRGWRWGGRFARLDGMHFQLATGY